MQVRSLICLFLLAAAGLEACKNPLDGVKIGLKDPLQDGVATFRFYDPAGNPMPSVNQVTLAGPDASQIVTTLNSTRYKLNSDGMLMVAPSPTTEYSAQKPLRFSVVLEANDYLTVIQPVVISDVKQQFRWVRRININKPPVTLNAARTTASAAASGQVKATVSLNTTPQGTDTDRATATLPAGTTLSDRNGNSIGGNLTMVLIHTNARNAQAAQYVPGEGVMSSVAARNGGASLGTMRFISLAGSTTLQIYNNQFELTTALSPAVPITMELYQQAYNAQQNRVVQAGDSIPLFSYDEFTNQWQEEKPGVVRKNQQTGRLEYTIQATRAVAYVAGWAVVICASGPVFKVDSRLANVDVNYLCKLIDVATGNVVSTFYANANNGSIIWAYNQLKNQRLKLQVFDETDAWGKGAKGGLIGESAPGLTCDQTPIPINLGALPEPPPVTLEIKFSCPTGTTLDEASLPAIMKTQYSEVGKNEWNDLISVTRTNRKVVSYKIKMGRYYDFRASTDGGASWPLRQSNYLVDKSEWTLKINADMYCK
ncbi:hypothetical protein [Spirosoma linguale]|uniref:Uncharacterized protein n=1 Tax=Spirosoma linguale (strain ATCC 33905 / DSM 74 / LMG 10896 / Claus 1) TaxID=504472 RepID=D2QU89_SPILD|nr:hypothetical protein Slin_6414 [Spirosoma linguale DSM 74]